MRYGCKTKVTPLLLFIFSRVATSESRVDLIFKTHKTMNSKKLILLSCVVPCVFAVSTATAQMRGHHAPMARMPMHRAPMLGSTAGMPMHRASMLSSASGFRRFNDRDFDRDDRFRRFHRFNDGDFDRDDRFRRFHHFNRFNEIVFFDDFGFPFFPFYYPPPYYPYPYYPYGYGGYGYQGGYGNGSSVVQLQRRLARAGYYHGAIDGIMGPATRRAMRAYENTHNQRGYGMTDHY